jgi:PAS domain S-box-containing protein
VRIIIVDDEAEQVEALTRALQGNGSVLPRGTSVVTACTLAEYRAAVTAEPPDIALVALNLSDGSAVDILTDSCSQSFPVLIMTNDANEQAAEQALLAGAQNYLVKSPENLATLGRTVQYAVREWHLASEYCLPKTVLLENQDRYQVLIGTSMDGFCLLSKQGRLLEVNDAYCTMTGYTREELLGMSIADLDCSETPEQVAEHLELLWDKGWDRFESRHRSRQGGVKEVEISTAYRPERGEFICFVRDVSQRRQDEERIGHLNRVLRTMRSVDQLILRERYPGRLIREICHLLVEQDAYPGTLAILLDAQGLPLDYASAGKGKKFGQVGRMLDNGLLPSCCLVEGHQQGVFFPGAENPECSCCPRSAECALDQTMCVALRCDGTRYGYLSVAVLQGQLIDADEAALFSAMADDVSYALYGMAQRSALVRMQQERDGLEAELRQSQKMEAIGQLAGGIAHDFNNMLSVILGFSQIGLSMLEPDDPLYINLQQIDVAGRRCADLTRQLLAFSRKQVAQPSVLNLNDAVSALSATLGRLVGEDLKILLQPGRDLWNVCIDPAQLEQILANLVQNARDAMAGSGVITIACANVPFAMQGDRPFKLPPGEYVRISVEDSGCGIDQATRERIFEPFFSTKEKGLGTGLGLSTVYGIVDQNEGAMTVQSAPGQGTRISIFLPRVLAETEPRAGTALRRRTLAGTETLLVVEDEAQILQLAKNVLEQHGYRVLPASAAEEACEISRAFPDKIDLLLTDIMLPCMNGRELQQHLKAYRPEIRTLFMSGYPGESIGHRGVIDSGVEFLAKPFTIQALLGKVRAVLDS